MKTGIELIAKERKEQIQKHGFNTDYDKKHHSNGSLSWNAAVLAAPTILYHKHDYANDTTFKKAQVDDDWKLPYPHFMPHRSNVITDNEGLPKCDRIKQLIVSGALIAAEIDRLQRIK